MPNEPTSAVAKTNKDGKGAEIDALIAVNERTGGVQLTTLPEIHRYAQWVIESEMAPPCYKTAGQIVVAIQTGAETGMTAMASVRSIYVVPGSGLPSWRTEAIRALIRRGFQDPFTGKINPVLLQGTDLEEGVFHDHTETGHKKDCKDTCYGWARSYPKAKNGEQVETKYSVGHAKQAGLWSNDKRPGWKNNPERMLMHRAGAFHGRDYYGGILMGLMSQDEAEEVSANTVPSLHRGVIDSDDTKPKGDPLFTTQEAVSDAVTVDVSPGVTDPPAAESEGPLFDHGGNQLEEREKRLDVENADPAGDYKGDYCPDHLEQPDEECPTCNEIAIAAAQGES